MMNDSVEMPVKKKGKQSDTRMLTALQLRYRAIQDTDKSVIDDSTYWLIQGGYTEEDKNTLGVSGWRHLCNNFSQQWYLYKKKNPIPEEQKPLWEQDFMKNFVQLEPVPEYVTELFPKIIQYMDNLKTSAYKNLVNVNFQQYDITSFLNKVPQGKRAKASNATPMKAFERYFKNIGMEKKGITLHNLICNVLKNTSDEFDFQDAHQDYFPKVISIKVPNYTKLHLAWSAIIPMTSDGSWITIWYSQDVHRTFQIKYGETLLFRSDVVHCGGRPGVDLRKEATFYRLHFYLQTEFQMAPDNEVNKFHIDGTTSLTTLYRQTIEQKKKYSNK